MSCNMVFSKLIKEVGEWSRHNFGSQKGAGALAPLDAKQFQEWMDNVEHICELHNATLTPNV